jgi:uncharacterized membrane protein
MGGKHAMTENGTYRLPVDIRTVDVDRSGHWLAAGWRDFLKTPRVSLIYGGAFVIVSFLLTFGLISAGLGSLVLPLAGGFVLLAPILVVGLYDVSRRLEQGRDVSFGHVFSAFSANIGQLSAMGVVLLILWFVWVEMAIVLFALFFNQAPPPLDRFLQEIVFSIEAAPFLLLGSTIGAIIATIIFCISAVSVPLMFDRQVDVVTAIGASILAVRANWQVMFGWAAMIVVISVVGVLSFFLGLAVALPVLAYATWHAYRDLVLSSHAMSVSDVEGFGSGI